VSIVVPGVEGGMRREKNRLRVFLRAQKSEKGEEKKKKTSSLSLFSATPSRGMENV